MRTMSLGLGLALAACADGAATPPPPQQQRAAVEAAEPLRPAWMQWNAPVAPHRIAGNLYSVGAANVAAFVLRTSDGLILLDTGFAQTVPQIAANLKTLGMDIADVRLILTSHAHVDHVAGVARVRADTGAVLAASAADAELMARGGRGDFAWGDDLPYPRVTADRILRDGERVTLGDTTLTAHITPGHTRGCTTWSFRVNDGARSVDVVYFCGTSAPGYDLVDNAAYPGIAADFRRSFDAMAALPCDIALAGHPQGIDLAGKAARAGAGGANPFVDRAGCAGYLSAQRAAFERELARQQAGGAPRPM